MTMTATKESEASSVSPQKEEITIPWSDDEEYPRRLLCLNDGTLVAYGGGDDGSVIVRVDKTSQILHTWEDDAVRAVAETKRHDETIVAVGIAPHEPGVHGACAGPLGQQCGYG